MIIFEVNFLLIYKNIDEFGIVCKKKRVFYKKITIILFGPFFFFSFFLLFFLFFVLFVVVFFFPLRNVKVGGAAYTAVLPLRRKIRYFLN